MTEQLYRRRAGDPVPLAECPVGLFECGGELCLKTEYGNNEGRIDAYIVSSGEFFWGAAPQTIASQRATVVTPIDYEPLPAPAPDARNCTCNLRTRLVGDGCDVCNPDLAGTVAPAPDAREALDEATLTVIYEALRFADWAAGEGICPDTEGRPEPAEFLSDFIDAKGLTELDYADLPEYVRQALARIGGGR